MRLTIKYLKQILLIAFLMISCKSELFGQEAGIIAKEKPGMFIGLSLGAFQSQILNEGTASVSELVSSKKNTFFRSVDFGYFFTKNIGLSSGIGNYSYGTQVTLDTYQNKIIAVDSENEAYELRVSGSAIKEEQKIGLLGIPLCIVLRLPISKSIGFILQPGLNFAIPLSRNYQSSGTFTYRGYYPAYNVILENLPDYGYPSDLSSKTTGKLELNPIIVNAIVSAGFDFFVTELFKIAIDASYDRSLSGISKYNSPDNFQLSTEVSQINSLMGGSSKTTVQSIGVKIGFRYYFNQKKIDKPQNIQVN